MAADELSYFLLALEVPSILLYIQVIYALVMGKSNLGRSAEFRYLFISMGRAHVEQHFLKG